MEFDETDEFDHNTVKSIPTNTPTRQIGKNILNTFAKFDYSGLFKIPSQTKRSADSNQEWLDSVI